MLSSEPMTYFICLSCQWRALGKERLSVVPADELSLSAGEDEQQMPRLPPSVVLFPAGCPQTQPSERAFN